MAKRVETTSLQFQISINGERKVLKTLKEVRAERRTLIKQLETQSLSQKEYNDKVKELQKLNGIIRDHQQTVKGTGRAYQQAGKAATGFKGLLQGIGPALKAAFGPVGLILQAVTIIIGLGKAAAEAAAEMQQVNERVNQLTGLVGEDLKNASASVVAIGKTFEVDITNGLDAANSAAKAYKKEGEELGIVFEKSLNGIGSRLLALDGKGDEFLSQIKEYAPQAAQAGIGMDRFFNIVTTGINQGIETDKLIDSVKEFNIRIKDLSKGQKDTLDQVFGKQFTDQIVQDIETGAISSIQALDRIAEETRELGTDSAAAQKVVSNLFGGAGEDATARYLTLIADVGSELSDVVDTTNIYVKRKQELLVLEKESAAAAAELAFITDGTGDTFEKVGLLIKTKFLTELSKIIGFIRYFPEFFSAATESGKAFINTLVGLLEKVLQPLSIVFEKLFDIEIKIPRFEVESDPFGKVRAKIISDRKAFEEQQRQQVLEEQGRTEAAQRLKALQAQKRRFAELRKEEIADQKRRAEDEKKAAQAIEDLRLSILKNGVEKQIALLQLQAQRRIEALKGTEEQIATQTRLIQEKLSQDIAAANQKAEEAKLKASEQNSKKLLQAEEKAYQNRVAQLEANLKGVNLRITQEILQDVEAGLVEGVDAEKLLQDRLLEAYTNFLTEKKLLAEQAGKDITAIELEQEKQKLANLLALEKEQAEVEKGKEELKSLALNAGFELAEGLAEKSLQNELTRLAQRREQLENDQAAALELAGDNQSARLALQQKFAADKLALDKEQGKKEKVIALKRSLIDFALALFKAIAVAPTPLNLPSIIATQALLAVPQAILSSISFGTGGQLPIAGKGGMPQGSSHQQGHIYLLDGRTGQVAGAIEGGEPILSKATYANNKALIDELLYASMYQGGRKIFQDGGFLASPSTTPSQETVNTTQANPQLARMDAKFDELIHAYRSGKTVLVGEREADLFGEMISDRGNDKIRRSL